MTGFGEYINLLMPVFACTVTVMTVTVTVTVTLRVRVRVTVTVVDCGLTSEYAF